jgi:hypothetical protein
LLNEIYPTCFLAFAFSDAPHAPQAVKPQYLDPSIANKFRTAPALGPTLPPRPDARRKLRRYRRAITRHGGEETTANAFTAAFKELDPIPQFRATAKLGSFVEVVSPA